MMYLVSFSLPRFASILHSAMRDYLIKHRLFFCCISGIDIGKREFKGISGGLDLWFFCCFCVCIRGSDYGQLSALAVCKSDNLFFISSVRISFHVIISFFRKITDIPQDLLHLLAGSLVKFFSDIPLNVHIVCYSRSIHSGKYADEEAEHRLRIPGEWRKGYSLGYFALILLAPVM